MRKLILIIIFISSSSLSCAWNILDQSKNKELANFEKAKKEEIKKNKFEIDEGAKLFLKYTQNKELKVNQEDSKNLAYYAKVYADVNFIQDCTKIYDKTLSVLDKYVDSGVKQDHPAFKVVIDVADVKIELLERRRIEIYELADSLLIENNILFGKKLFTITENWISRNQKLEKDFMYASKESQKNIYVNIKRNSLKDDVVAQVLNYSIGTKEDGSGDNYFYPIDTSNGNCIYKIGSANTQMGNVTSDLVGAINLISKIPGIQGLTNETTPTDTIDLAKADLSNIGFFEIKGNNSNKNGKTPFLKYQVKVEGLPDYFVCDSNTCNIERLKRGWNLVKEKCKGTQKAF